MAIVSLNQLHLIQLMQFNDSPSYTQVRSFVQKVNPSVLLFPNSQKDSRLHVALSSLSDRSTPLQIMIVARKYFDETEGQHLLKDLMVCSLLPFCCETLFYAIERRTWCKSGQRFGKEVLGIGFLCMC